MENNRYNIIVVDDEEALREYVCNILERKGYRVRVAKDGNEALAIATATSPDLIITDMVMPDKEGVETIREVKSRFPECGIIAMSGTANSDLYLSIAQGFGAFATLHKPFTRAEVEYAVQSTLESLKSKK
jgi:CheY-like chemotaxis protein